MRRLKKRYLAVLAAITIILTLGGCETVRLKAKGGSNTGIDWGIGIRL